MQRNLIVRIIIYLAGLVILALGITLNVKTGLGVSPIISVAHVFAVILVFTRVMNIFEYMIPQLDQLPDTAFFGTFGGRILALLFAIAATGIGAAASLDMRIVPNPGDGIVQAISDLSGKETGLVKNIFDGFNVALSIMLGLLFAKGIVGIGIGTIIAFLGVGRFVALFNRFCFPFIRSVVADS